MNLSGFIRSKSVSAQYIFRSLKKVPRSSEIVRRVSSTVGRRMNGDSHMEVNGEREGRHPPGGSRGALIVLEGCDKAGKSTQCRLLVDALNKEGRKSHLFTFPDRTTEIGKVIDQYLKCNKSLSDEAIHLLFSSNRWEVMPTIRDLLQRGESVILDRYAFSGVAFTAAKGTLDLEWCKAPDVGLPQPDVVLFLNLSEEAAATRGDYGQERYEKAEFQKKVKSIFLQIQDPAYWKRYICILFFPLRYITGDDLQITNPGRK